MSFARIGLIAFVFRLVLPVFPPEASRVILLVSGRKRDSLGGTRRDGLRAFVVNPFFFVRQTAGERIFLCKFASINKYKQGCGPQERRML